MIRFFAALLLTAAASWATPPCTRAQSVAVDFTGTTFTVVAAVNGQKIKVCSYALTTTAATPADFSFVSNPSGTVLEKLLGVSGIFDNNTDLQIQTRLNESLGIVVSTSTHWTGRVAFVTETF